MLPVSGEQHEKACDEARDKVFVPAWAADELLAAYFASLAAQGVRLVDVREVAEWLRLGGWPLVQPFLARFGGGDER